MIGIVLFTHGTLGQALIEAVELITGKQEQIHAVGLKHGDGVDEFEARCKAALAEADKGDGVLAFVDFIGGTPANTALRLMRDKPFPCVAGVNMPMLLEVATARDGNSTAHEMESLCMDVAPVSFQRLAACLESMEAACGDNPDDF